MADQNHGTVDQLIHLMEEGEDKRGKRQNGQCAPLDVQPPPKRPADGPTNDEGKAVAKMKATPERREKKRARKSGGPRSVLVSYNSLAAIKRNTKTPEAAASVVWKTILQPQGWQTVPAILSDYGFLAAGCPAGLARKFGKNTHYFDGFLALWSWIEEKKNMQDDLTFVAPDVEALEKMAAEDKAAAKAEPAPPPAPVDEEPEPADEETADDPVEEPVEETADAPVDDDTLSMDGVQYGGPADDDTLSLSMDGVQVGEPSEPDEPSYEALTTTVSNQKQEIAGLREETASLRAKLAAVAAAL